MACRDEASSGLAGRTLFRNVNVLRDAERRRKLCLQSFSGDVLVESAGILGQRLYAPLRSKSRRWPVQPVQDPCGQRGFLAVLVEMHREPGDAAPDFALSDGDFVSSPAVVNDIEQRRFAGFGRTVTMLSAPSVNCTSRRCPSRSRQRLRESEVSWRNPRPLHDRTFGGLACEPAADVTRGSARLYDIVSARA